MLFLSYQDWIADYMATSDDVKNVRIFYATKNGRRVVEKYLFTAEKYHPNIVSEVRGLADGSCQSFIDIFLLQIVSEITFCHINNLHDNREGAAAPTQSETGKGCTDILVNNSTCRVIGHNDDWTDDVTSHVCIVHVTIEGVDVMERFMSYVYPGYIAGFCFGMNKELVITLNSLSPKEANESGVPLLIVLRSLLSSASIDECITRLESKPVGCAYGMNINIAAINSNDMCSVEVYTEKVSIRIVIPKL